MPRGYQASEEEYGHGYGGGAYGDGGAIASQINRGTDIIREDLARGGEALRESNRNYFQNLGNAVEKGMEGYERGQKIRTEEEKNAREAERFDMEKKRFGTEEEEARQRMEASAAQLAELKRQAKANERKEAFDTGIDPTTGKSREEMTWQMPFDKFNLEQEATKESIAGGKENRRIAGATLKLAQDQDARSVAAAKAQKENEAYAAGVSQNIMSVPEDQVEQAAATIMAQTPPEKRAAAFEAISKAKGARFAEQLAKDSSPLGKMRLQALNEISQAAQKVVELQSKLDTFKQNASAGSLIQTRFGDFGPDVRRNEQANLALSEIAQVIAADGTPQALALAEQIQSGTRMDSDVINDVQSYINARGSEAKNYKQAMGSMFTGPDKKKFEDSLAHLTSAIGGGKNRPPGKTNPGNVGAFLTGGSSAPEPATPAPQLTNMVGPAQAVPPPQGAAPQGSQAPMQAPQGGPMPPPQQGYVSPLRGKYGR